MNQTALSVTDVSKRYPGVLALDGVSLEFLPGEVHALVGENGAGKSTLIKVISGFMMPDEGSIEVAGRRYAGLTPRQAMDLGIGTIYQDANLVPDLSVAENVCLGDLPRGGLFVHRAQMDQRVREVLDLLGIDLDPSERVSRLSVSQAQFVANAKAVANDARVLIMDEPTAALTDAECGRLFDLVERLRGQGVCVIYITHRLHEVFSIADRISVMRDGRLVTTTRPSEVTEDELVGLIAGRRIDKAYPERAYEGGDVLMRVEGLSGEGVRDVSFELRRGEILGFAGLMGSGRTEVGRMLFGADRKQSGSVTIDDVSVEVSSPEGAVHCGLGYVPADRKGQGVILDQSVRTNISLPALRRLSRLAVDRRRETSVVGKYVDDLGIKTPSQLQAVRNLSGGNQQKVALGKWLASQSKVLVLDEPTQGVDVGARHEIYRTMNELTRQGISIIMLSSDLDELMGMADRIVVMHEGTVAGTLDNRADYSQEAILRYASGLDRDKEAA